MFVARHDGPGQSPDYATALAIAPDGSTVIVTGTSDGRHSTDYVTIAYRI
jgi:hypothetical protein